MPTAPATQQIAPSPRFTSVRVVNKGKTDFIDAYGGQRFLVPAGGEAFVPFDAVCLWFGDPGTVDLSNSPSDRHRTNEFGRVKHRLGYHDGTFNGEPIAWDDHRPALEAYTTDGTRIRTVADDPEGEPQNLFGAEGSTQTVEERLAYAERVLGRLQDSGKLDSILDELAGQEPSSNVQDEEIPEDSPSSGRRGPKIAGTQLTEPPKARR